MFFTITKLRIHKRNTNVSGLKKIIEVTSMNFTGYILYIKRLQLSEINKIVE